MRAKTGPSGGRKPKEGDESKNWAMNVDNAKGGWAQTSPPLAFWSLPLVAQVGRKPRVKGVEKPACRLAGRKGDVGWNWAIQAETETNA